jgi:ADP-ribose pyrophosphatase YjhB (NUDIX family)
VGIFRDPSGRVLLLDHGRYRRRYPWGLPGGWQRRAESLTGTITREMREETGLAVRVESLFRVISGFAHPRIEFVVTGTIEEGTPRLTDEVRAFRFVAPGDDTSMIVPRHQKLLDLYFAGGGGEFESSPTSLAAHDPGQ